MRIENIADLARELGVPYHKAYHGAQVAGVKEVNEDTIPAILIGLQTRAVSFTALARILGYEVTLGDLALIERVREEGGI